MYMYIYIYIYTIYGDLEFVKPLWIQTQQTTFQTKHVIVEVKSV